jgi:putative ABC transport system permease protein
MEWATRIWLRLRAMVQRRRFDRDLEEEIRFHLAMREEKYRADGIASGDAKEAARRRFGNVTLVKETSREMWTLASLESFAQDAKYSLRMLRKNPGFTVIAVLTLAFGIGANTAIFSVVDAVLLRSLPYKNPRELVWLWCKRTDRAKAPFSIADLEDYERQSRSFESVAAFRLWGANLTGTGVPERVQGIQTTGSFFKTVGVAAATGRTIEPSDDLPGAAPVVVLTNGFWQRQFGGDRTLIGRTVSLNGLGYTVIGVLPHDFFFPFRDAEMATQFPLATDPRRADRGDRFLDALGRLRAGTTPQEAEAELATIAQRLAQQYPKVNNKNTGVRAIPITAEIIGSFRLALIVLLGAVGMVLLVACANLAHLMLARSSARQRELAVRLVLGATPGRLARQFLVESALLTAAGGLLGILFARWGIPLLMTLRPSELPVVGKIMVDGSVLAFALTISFLAAILIGLAPALQAGHADLNQMVKSTGPVSGAASAGKSLRELLVVAEAGLAVVLVTGAGLFAKSFVRLGGVDPGFDSRGVLAVQLSLSQARYPTVQSLIPFYEGVKLRLEHFPGVESVGMTSILPLSGRWASTDFTIVGRPPVTASEVPSAQYRVASPDYFRTMRIPLVAGRAFTEEDGPESQPVVLINQTLARRFWPNSNPLGVHLKLEGFTPRGGEAEIVGVVGNVKHLALDAEPTSDLYVPVRHAPPDYLPYLTNTMFWVVRSPGSGAELAAAIRKEVHGVDAEVATSGVKPMADFVSGAEAPRRFNAQLVSFFAAVALLLAAMGIYGVIAFSVVQQTREIGVRMALGAQPSSVLRSVIGQGIRLAAIGIAAGLAVSLLLTRWIAGLLYGVAASDAATLAEASVLLLGVALVACYIPARRAMRVDPMVALRYE